MVMISDYTITEIPVSGIGKWREADARLIRSGVSTVRTVTHIIGNCRIFSPRISSTAVLRRESMQGNRAVFKLYEIQLFVNENFV